MPTPPLTVDKEPDRMPTGEIEMEALMVALPLGFANPTVLPQLTEQEYAMDLTMEGSYLIAIAKGMDQLPYELNNLGTHLPAYRNGLIPGDFLSNLMFPLYWSSCQCVPITHCHTSVL